MSAAALAAVGLALAGCGGTNAQSPAGTVSASVKASATPVMQSLLVVADPSPDTGTIRFFSADGHEVSHVPLATGAHIVGVAGARVFLLTQNGALTAIHRDGSTEQLGNLGASVPFAARPDGTRWVWATQTSTTDGTVTSSIHLGGDGLTPRVLETVTEQYDYLRPYEWTSAGLFVDHAAMGIGGYIPYLEATGPVDRLDVETNKVTKVAGSDKCTFSDMSTNGTVACFPDLHTLRIVYPDGRVSNISLATPRFNASGDAYFSADGAQLTVAGATLAGAQKPNSEQYGTDLVQVSDASISRLSLDGVRPAEFMRAACWLADGSLVVYRPENSADGPGVYLYGPSGTSTFITKTGLPVGILTQ